MNEQIEILIVSSSQEDCDLIVDQVSKNYKAIHTANDSETAIQLFEKHKPQLIFVAFDKIEYSEHFYLYLYRNSPNIRLIQHQIILMCPAPEAKKASELCKSEIFDDYIVYKPAYDIYRIDLAILQALKRLENHPVHVNAKLAPYLNLAESMYSSMKESITESKQVKTVADKSYVNLQRSIGQHIEELGQLLNKNAGMNDVDIHDPIQFAKLLKQFQDEKLLPELNSAHQEVDNAIKTLVNARKTDYEHYHKPVKEVAELMATNTYTLLLIDDDDMFLAIMSSVLEPEGFKVLTANDAKHGLATMLKEKPNLVLVDLNMPDRNGIELIQTAKNNHHLVHIPFIMMTGHSHKDTLAAVIKAGAADFIVKPPEREVLLNKIHKHLHRGGATKHDVVV